MVNAIYASIWVLALWKWGDWKNWRTYYPTILFFCLGDFLYLYLLSDAYPMWRYNPPSMDERMGLTNTHVSLSIMAVKYPATVLIFLSKFPETNKWKQIVYIIGWVCIYSINEIIDVKTNVINYYHGWSFWWSTFFNLVLFCILRIHHINQPLAWIISMGYMFFLWQIFDIPSSVFR